MGTDKTCLVAGGAGFIGSHLVDSLLESGCRVIAVDNLITGNITNLSQHKNNGKFTFLELDVTKKISYGDIGQVDYIFHLASPASVPDYQKFPKETALSNSTGTQHLLDLATDFHASFLFASTSEVYGDPLEHPQKETYWGNVNPVGVRACYDESKRFGETLTMLYHRLYQTDVRIIRIFNTYGPRMRPTDGRVVSNFINQALQDEALTIYGDGNQTRSLTYVDDLVAGIKKAMFEPSTNGEVFNLGNPQEMTMNDLAKLVGSLIHKDIRIEYKPLPLDDPRKRRPDITKAQQTLKWKPLVAAQSGIPITIEYYRGLLQ
jgi:nucleoside-diphosphate-sugar epimerase